MEQREIAVGETASVHAVPQSPQDSVRSLVRKQVAAAAMAAGSRGVRAPSAQSDPVPKNGRGELYRTMGDGFTRAVELAVTPALFGAMGYGLDRWLGSMPVFTIILSLIAIIGMLLRTWYGYVYRMQALEQEAAWAKRK